MKTMPVMDTSPLVLPPQSGRTRSFPWGRLIALLLGLLCLPVLMMNTEGQRALLALCFTSVLFFLLKRSPSAGVAGTIIYLSLVGGLRRWLIPLFGWSGTDSLLVVAPSAAILYFLTTRRNYPFTPLMRLTLGLLLFMVVEIVNPIQGGLAVGAAGALFLLAPLFWYFVGRQIGSPAVTHRLMQVLVVVALCAALYGLYQTYFGFNTGELMWIKTTYTAYGSLMVGGTLRAFSFFTSAAEYAQFLGLGVVVLWVAFLRGHRLALLPIPLLVVALFFASIRYAVVTTLIACVFIWAIQGRSYRSWLPRGLGGLAVAVVILFFGLSHIQEQHFSESTANLAEHTAQGLLNPGDEAHSTAGFHIGEVINGFEEGFRNPIGHGLGATTIASNKFGGDTISSEFDISNMFISLGFAGGFLYVIMIGVILTLACRYWHQSRSIASLAIVGILVQLLGVWSNGGFYAASTLAWLCAGIVERQILMQDRKGSRGVPTTGGVQRQGIAALNAAL